MKQCSLCCKLWYYHILSCENPQMVLFGLKIDFPPLDFSRTLSCDYLVPIDCKKLEMGLKGILLRFQYDFEFGC